MPSYTPILRKTPFSALRLVGKRTLLVCWACCVALSTSAQNPSPGPPVPSGSAPGQAPSPEASPLIGASLPKASPGDMVKVDIFDEPSVSGSFSINQSGDILYPLIGKIQVAGMNSDQIAEQVETLLETDYIRDANVSVAIAKTDVSSASVLIFGGVRSPGQVSFPKQEALELFRAISECGGFNERARQEVVEVQRAGDSGLKRFNINLSANEDFSLEDGDVVVVKETPPPIIDRFSGQMATPMGSVIVLGQVSRPGKVEIPLDSPTNLLTVIALAGDFSRLARKSKVTVTRQNTQTREQQAFTVDVEDVINGKAPQFAILPGDTIYVPESRF